MTPESTVCPEGTTDTPTAPPSLSGAAPDLKAVLHYVMTVHDLLGWAPAGVVPPRAGIG